MKNDALKDAVKYLAVRSRSEAEVKSHLSKNHHEEAQIEVALDELRQRGFLGDEALSRSWAAELAAKGRSGRSMALHKLMERGIPKEIAEASVDLAWSAVDESAAATELLKRRFRTQSTLPKDKNEMAKAARFLRSRGYGSEAISKALREAFGGEE